MNKKMTFLAFSLDHGGAEKVCLTLCNEFVKRNYEIRLWVVNYRESALTQQLDPRVDIFPLNKKKVRGSLLPLIRIFLRQKPEKILVFHLELAILAIVIKKLFFLKTKIIIRSINTLSHAFQYPNGAWEKYFAKRIIKYTLPHSNKIIAQSKGMQEDLLHWFGNKNNKILTIPNPACNRTVNGASIKGDPIYENEFLFVGRLSPQKGLTNLIKAFKMAHNQNRTIHLTLVGEGEEKKKLEKMTKDLGLDSSITFEGYQANTIPYFKRAKATVLTSVFEGFPNVLVESIASGTPVISFNCPSGPQDIIIPGVNGILVDNNNLNDFSEALLVISSGTLNFDTQDIIKTARRFSTETIVAKYEQVFMECESH